MAATASSSSTSGNKKLSGQIKSLVGKLNSCLDDFDHDNEKGGVGVDEDGAATTIDDDVVAATTKCYLALLRLELVQRGVVVDVADYDDGDNEQQQEEDFRKVLSQVVASAGRPLITAATADAPPPQLMAGSSVVQGRVAERLADLVVAKNGAAGIAVDDRGEEGRILLLLLPTDDGSSSGDSQQRVLDDAKRRCREVSDERFEALLNLAAFERRNEKSGAPATGTDKGSTTTTTTTAAALAVADALRYAAEGCYYRAAATFQPDTPPIWKRAYDVTLAREKRRRRRRRQRQRHRQRRLRDNNKEDDTTGTELDVPDEEDGCYYTWESTYALDNLRRIARQKGNAKRASELDLKLAASALLSSSSVPTADLYDDDEDVATTTELSSVIVETVKKAFVSGYRPSEPPTRSESAERASEYLRRIDDGDDDSRILFDDNQEDKLLFLVLQLLSELVREDAAIDDEAREAYESAKNRSSSSSVRQRSQTLNEYRTQARRRYLAAEDKNEINNAKIDSRAASLRDAVVVESSIVSSTSSASVADWAYRVLTKYLLRQRDRAQVVSLGGGGGTAKCEKDATVAAAAIATKKRQAWASIATFLRPMLGLFEKRFASDTTGPIEKDAAFGKFHDRFRAMSFDERRLITTIVLLVPCIEWVYSGFSFDGDGTFPDCLTTETEMRLARDILSYLSKDAVATIKAKQRASGVVQSTATSDDDAAKRFQCAHRSIRALLYLVETDSAGNGNDAEFLRETAQMTVSKVDDVDVCGENSISEFGMSFLEFLVCWSGLHQRPWPFCAMAEARNVVSKARVCLQLAEKKWGRYSFDDREESLLDLALADAERSSSGGLLKESRNLYYKIISRFDTESLCSAIVMVRCYAGLIGIASGNLNDACLADISDVNGRSSEGLARLNLQLIQSVKPLNESTPLYFWRSRDATVSALRFQLAAARQQVADCLIRKDRPDEALSFLEDAVNAAPSDPIASFSLGAFRLRLFFLSDSKSPDEARAAQMQLLKAAKLDSTKASPFALLGCWYEYNGDLNRAVGCYSKALLIDPWHPVAGRGLLRLRPSNTLSNVFEKAVGSNTPLNGWAWRAIGLRKAMKEGNDDLAVIALLRALRSRDIHSPSSEPLSVFYADPFHQKEADKSEFVATSADLAAAYRRLGRYTASIRSYYVAIAEAGDAVSDSILCACAEGMFMQPNLLNLAIIPSFYLTSQTVFVCQKVEMELGLFDEASEKLYRAIRRVNGKTRSVVAYSLAVCLLSSAQRDSRDGKAGAALRFLKEAATYSAQLDDNFGCAQKLIGDIYSFGAVLPPDVFYEASENSNGSTREESSFRALLAFVNNGIEAYRAAEQYALNLTDRNEGAILQTGIVTDLASNLLLQGQILCRVHSKGYGIWPVDDFESIYKHAEAEFRRALSICPLYAPAWCGLGCSVVRADPLLAQHAFCRSIELDSLSPDPYANLSFLYMSTGLVDRSLSVSDALTQVADTPMMWINRALAVELRAKSGGNSADRDILESNFRQAVDAYQAALQVANIPIAKKGLALAYRATILYGDDENARNQDSKDECSHLLSEYRSATGGIDVSPRFFGAISDLEIGAISYENRYAVNEGKAQIEELLEQYEAHGDGSLPGVDLIRKCVSLSSIDGAEEKAGSNTEKEESVSETPALSCDLARRVLYEPDRGDLWLDLAKELARNGSKLQQNQQQDDAYVASRKARRILLNRANDPPPPSLYSRTGKRATVDAYDVADALSLCYWLEQAIGVGASESKAHEADETEEKDQEDEVTNRPASTSATAVAPVFGADEDGVIDVQRALILCPNNVLAREIVALEAEAAS